MKSIRVRNLQYSYVGKYQTVHVLKGINCTFEAGKFYAITGASGSGKTTFLSLLAGMGNPSEGNISVDGVDLKNVNKDTFRLKRVAVIYQAYNLFPLMNALENVMYPMLENKIPQKQAEETAKESILMVGLKEKVFKQYPQMMSGGEQQRVAIARAMSNAGDIFLADEPTGNLDLRNKKKVLEILQDLARKQGQVVIVITHDQSIAQMADVNYKMIDGKMYL